MWLQVILFFQMKMKNFISFSLSLKPQFYMFYVIRVTYTVCKYSKSTGIVELEELWCLMCIFPVYS